MSRHVYWHEAGEELRTGGWGEQAETATGLVRGITDQRRMMCLLIDMARSLREIDHSLRALRCPNFIDVPRRLNKIVKNTTKRRRVNGKTK